MQSPGRPPRAVITRSLLAFTVEGVTFPLMSMFGTFGRAVGLIAIFLATAGFAEALFAPKAEPWPKWERHDPTSALHADHGRWNEFLNAYRSLGEDGIARVAYGAVTPEDRAALDGYLDDLQAFHVLSAARDEQFAYWVNLYNALTVKVVLDAYPVESIQDIDLGGGGFFSSGPWDAKIAEVEGETLSLNDIEHRILRPIWRDPRTHYVVNCASIGCPNLPERALEPGNLEDSLDRAARAYVNHPRGVGVRDEQAVVSKIYGWFRADFGNSGPAVLRHLRAFAEPELATALARVDAYDLEYRYDWSLNGRVK